MRCILVGGSGRENDGCFPILSFVGNGENILNLFLVCSLGPRCHVMSCAGCFGQHAGTLLFSLCGLWGHRLSGCSLVWNDCQRESCAPLLSVPVIARASLSWSADRQALETDSVNNAASLSDTGPALSDSYTGSESLRYHFCWWRWGKNIYPVSAFLPPLALYRKKKKSKTSCSVKYAKQGFGLEDVCWWLAFLCRKCCCLRSRHSHLWRWWACVALVLLLWCQCSSLTAPRYLDISLFWLFQLPD